MPKYNPECFLLLTEIRLIACNSTHQQVQQGIIWKLGSPCLQRINSFLCFSRKFPYTQLVLSGVYMNLSGDTSDTAEESGN